jgi:hypothetical protein
MVLVVHVYPENRHHRWSLCYGAARPTSSRKYLAKGNASKLIDRAIWTFEGRKHHLCWECRNRQKAILAEARKG